MQTSGVARNEGGGRGLGAKSPTAGTLGDFFNFFNKNNAFYAYFDQNSYL